MYFNGVRVTLDNISKVFEGYPLDIRDEVRSMVIDNLDLSDWIDVCSSNPYRLNQIRLATLEGLDPRFFRLSSGSNIYELRSLANSGFNVEELLSYVGKGFDSAQWNYIISWAKSGLLDSRLNLVRTPFKMWHYIDEGLKNNLPMWVFTNGKLYSDSYMHSVITIMSNGYSSKKFLSGRWSDDVLSLLAEFSYRKWFSRIVSRVYNFISYDFLCNLGELAKEGVIDDEFFKIAHDNDLNEHYYLYQSDQLGAVLTCVRRGYDYSSLKDYDLTSTEISAILEELELTSKRTFRGRL